jgi:hypothetical protein
MSIVDPKLNRPTRRAALSSAPAIVPRRNRRLWLFKGALCLFSFALALGGVELAGRVIGHDFKQQRAKFTQVPIYYRQAVVPVGPAFYHRPGPDVWRGRILNQFLALQHVSGNPYPDEPEIEVTYDADGFRNPLDLTDWDVVIAGDSFTEAGYLAYEDLFTSQLAQQTGLRVRNLGQSGTGTIYQNCLLEHFGVSPSTKHAVIAYYEGNDPTETLYEHGLLRDALAQHVDPQSRPNALDLLPKQTSFLRAIYDRATTPTPQPESHCHAYYIHGQQRVPLSIYSVPIKFADLAAEAPQVSEQALADFVTFCRAHEITPWLVYLPSKIRVLPGYLEVVPGYEHLLTWDMGDIRERIQAICQRQNIAFIDTTPALRDSVEQGHWPFNTIYDTHLNATGSHCVGRVLAATLGDVVK